MHDHGPFPNLSCLRCATEKGGSVKESAYQAKLIKKLELRFPGCVILKNDPNYQQGMLDLTILYEDMWATLEVKASVNSRSQPNQEYFVKQLNDMSFAAFIYPENEEEVLIALQEAFTSRRAACLPQPELLSLD